MELKQFKKNDRVVMINLKKDHFDHGRVWTCDVDSFTSRKMTLHEEIKEVVFLQGYQFSFPCENLQIIHLSK